MDDYDFNFCFPVIQLDNTKLSLVPFQPALHGESIVTAFAPHPELFTYQPIEPFTSAAGLADLIENLVRKDPSALLFVVFDKTRHGPDRPVIAGLIGLINTSATNLVTEIAWVMTLPEFQRTHVTTNAVGLILHHCLDAPSERAGALANDPITGSTPGLGLRRVQWLANVENKASVRAAERMGFRYEGTIRWHQSLPVGKLGLPPRPNDPRVERPGRHTVMTSLCWDDWEGGARDKVRALMSR